MTSRTENNLLDDLQEMGYTGLRVDPNTGGHRLGHDGGDVIVGRTPPFLESVTDSGRTDTPTANVYVIEEKYSRAEASKRIELDVEKCSNMVEFAESFPAVPVLAVRWSTRLDWSPGASHFCIDLRDLNIRARETETYTVAPFHVDRDGFEATEVFFK